MIDPIRVFALAAMLGALGMWMMLPRGSHGGRWTGGVLIAGALGLGTSQVPWLGNWVLDALLFLLAGTTILAALATVTPCNPLRCAMAFGLVLMGTGGLLIFCGMQILVPIAIGLFGTTVFTACLLVLRQTQSTGDGACDRTSCEPLVSAAAGAVIVAVLAMTVCGITARVLGGVEAVGAQQRAEIVLLNNYLMVGAVLFGMGLIGVLSRRNLVVMLLAAELMMLGILLSLAAFGQFHGDSGGRMLVFFTVAFAVCQGAIGLALVAMLFQHRGKLDVAVWHALRESNQTPPEEKWSQAAQSGSAIGSTVAAVWRHLPPYGRVATRTTNEPRRSIFGRSVHFLMVRPFFTLAAFANWIDRVVIDGVANLCGQVPAFLGAVLRPTQSGLIQFYALAMVLGLLAFMGVLAM